MRKESLLTPPSSTDSIPVLFRSCWWLLTDLLLPPVQICRATYSTGKIVKINFSCCLMLSTLFFFWGGGEISGSDKYDTFVLCNVMFSSAKRKETFGCSSSHHPTCLLPTQPAHPLYTKSMHTRPYKHTATTRNFEVIAFSPNVESCTVNWKKTTFITTGLASMGWGGELLPSTGNNLDTSKRPGIKGPFFFFFLLALTRKKNSSLIWDQERLKGFLLMSCVLKIMELYRFLCCPFWGRWTFRSDH